MPQATGIETDPLTGRWLTPSYLVLLLPAVFFLFTTEPPPGSALLWLTGLIPLGHVASRGRWRATAVASGVVITAMLVTHLALAFGGRPTPPLLVHSLVVLAAVSAGAAWMVARSIRDQGAEENTALTDPLTRLPNHRHARVFLETMFGAAERGRPVAVILFDLDHLRRYNELHGEAAGTIALRRFADLLSASTRRMNLSARIGGEEFISILAGSEEDGARAFAERVRENLQSIHMEGSLTVSAGVAAYHPSMRSPDELVAAADLALYRAKEEGRNRVRVFGRDVRPGDVTSHRRPRTEPGRPEHGDALPAAPAPYAWDSSQAGKAPPPEDLLPDSTPQFGSGRTVLLVEHDADLEDTVGAYLRREGFEITEASDARAAIQALGHEYDVVLTDLHLPGLSGTELVRAVKSRWPATQVLVVAEARDAQRAADALSAGGDRFLYQPLTLPEFQTHLVDALARRDRIRTEHQRRHRLSQESFERADESRKMVVRGILSLARAAEMYDTNSQGHARCVAAYAGAIRDHLGERAGEVDPDLLNLACLVHNVGMLEVPETILNKDGPLSPEEFERIRRHPETGRRILEPLLGDELILAVTGWHHERWDGTGYPDGLAGEAIPLSARVVAMADALNAMTSRRAYRRPLVWEDAVRQIRDRAGTHFDPGLIDAFSSALPDLHRTFRQIRKDERQEDRTEVSMSPGPEGGSA